MPAPGGTGAGALRYQPPLLSELLVWLLEACDGLQSANAGAVAPITARAARAMAKRFVVRMMV